MSETRSPRAIPVPDAIRRSPLFAVNGGFGVYDGLPDSATFDLLFAEARACYQSATVQESTEPDREDIRGGKPRRKLLASSAGPAQDAMYASESLRGILSATCGLPIMPSGNRGSYSYYARPGDFLDLHRDVETCDVAMITALYDNSLPAANGGALVVYPGRVGEPLSAIRARPREGARLVKLAPGQTIILFGGVLPHCVLPVGDGQVRMVSVLCFRALM